MPWNYDAGPMHMGGFGILFMIIFWVLVIWGIITLIQSLSTQTDTTSEQENAEEILKKRYASGDISKEEYDSMLQNLRS